MWSTDWSTVFNSGRHHNRLGHGISIPFQCVLVGVCVVYSISEDIYSSVSSFVVLLSIWFWIYKSHKHVCINVSVVNSKWEFNRVTPSFLLKSSCWFLIHKSSVRFAIGMVWILIFFFGESAERWLANLLLPTKKPPIHRENGNEHHKK